MLSSDFRASLWTMKIATYNVNGVNGRLPRLVDWLRTTEPTIACLQELKTDDSKFPAAAIKEAVLSRRMPPWGAVKGFGDFRDDQGLTQEQIELITDWVEGSTARGNNPNMLPAPPKFDSSSPRTLPPPKGLVVSGDVTIDHAIRLDGLLPEKVPDGATMQIIARLPNGRIAPLLWLYEYRDSYRHPFLFRRPIDLPPGTMIRGVQPGTRLLLMSEERAKSR